MQVGVIFAARYHVIEQPSKIDFCDIGSVIMGILEKIFGSPNVKKLAEKKDVNDLIKALENNDNNVRRKAAEALKEIGDPKTVEPLIQVLNDNDEIVRQMAVRALQKIGDPKAIEPLIQTLNDKDLTVRGLARDALASIGTNGAIEPLIQALGDEDKVIRALARDALAKINGDKVIESLIQALNDKNEHIRIGAVNALKIIGDKRAFIPCIKALNDENSIVRGMAVFALATIDGENAVEPLIKVLTSDENSDVRGNAAWALGDIGDERAVEPLYHALNDKKIYPQRQAAIALRKIGGKKTAAKALKKITGRVTLPEISDQEITRLTNNLVSENGNLRNRAFEALQKAGDAAVQPLIKALEHENLMIRRQAAEALGMINTQGCIQALLNIFSDPRSEMFCRAEYALWLKGEQAVMSLINRLRDKDPKVRSRVAIALGHMIYKRMADPSNRIWLDPSSIDITDNIRNDINVGRVRSQASSPLKEMLKDKDESVKKYASYALEKL